MRETKYITLKANPALSELSDYVGRTPDELLSMIIETLLNYGMITDDRMYCGESLEHILELHHDSIENFAKHCFRQSYPRLLRILSGIIIWGIEHDCPYCGCGTFVESREKICIRQGCNFSVSLTPREGQFTKEFSINLN